MKILQLLFISIIFIGCSYNSASVKETEERPIDELSLIKKFNIADSLYMSESNDIKKTKVVEKQKAYIIKFITDTLHSQVKQWAAVVHEIKVDPLLNYTNVSLYISKKLGKYEDPSEFKTIILNAKVSQTDTIKNSLKDLLNGDPVWVSGLFEKDVVGKIDFWGKDADTRDTFSIPELAFQIKSISKKDN